MTPMNSNMTSMKYSSASHILVVTSSCLIGHKVHSIGEKLLVLETRSTTQGLEVHGS